MEGGVRVGGGGVKTPDNSTDIRLKTAKNNIGKPQTALNSKYPQTVLFRKTAIPQITIKIK